MNHPTVPLSIPSKNRAGWLKKLNLDRVGQEIWQSLKSIGFRRTCAAACSRLGDYWFDWRYGTSTIQIESLDDLQIASQNVIHGQRYQPTGAAAFQAIMKHVPPDEGDVFVDLGCGKGRSLMLAVLLGYRKVVGVDFSQVLCEVARNNLKLFLSRTQKQAKALVICADVADYELSDEETVLYFFHPFDEKIMRIFLDRLTASLERRPRRCRLVYYLPRHEEVLAAYPRFRKVREMLAFGYDCSIYEFLPE
jgi:SAM-dependent methyltransferase